MFDHYKIWDKTKKKKVRFASDVKFEKPTKLSYYVPLMVKHFSIRNMHWRFWCLISYYQWWHKLLWCHQYQYIGKGQFRQYVCYEKGYTACEGTSSQCSWKVTLMMACEVLGQSWSEAQFVYIQTLAGEYSFEWL